MPKELNHVHAVAKDVTHTAAEHCDNVIYHADVGDAHKCSHKFHLHTKEAHCFACDNHCTSAHTEFEILTVRVAHPDIDFDHFYALTLLPVLTSSICNKGPPLYS
jgi:hypothetical protein